MTEETTQKSNRINKYSKPLLRLRKKALRYKLYQVAEALVLVVIDGKIGEAAAALAYSLMSSLLTFFILLNGIFAFVQFDKSHITAIINQLFTGEVGNLLLSYLNYLEGATPGNLLLTSIILSVFSLAQMVNKLLQIMNKTYGITVKRPFFRRLLLSALFTAAMMVGIYFTLIVMMTSEDLLRFLDKAIDIPFALMQLWSWLRFVILSLVLLLLLLLFYCIAPNKLIPLKHALPGTLFALLVEMAATIGFSLYVEFFSTHAEVYGFFGGVLLLLLWLYLTSFILILGNECNYAVGKVYHRLPTDEER